MINIVKRMKRTFVFIKNLKNIIVLQNFYRSYYYAPNKRGYQLAFKSFVKTLLSNRFERVIIYDAKRAKDG